MAAAVPDRCRDSCPVRGYRTTMWVVGRHGKPAPRFQVLSWPNAAREGQGFPSLSDGTEVSDRKGQSDGRRMTWPDAVALLAVASVICWIVIASLFIGFDPRGGMMANDKEIRDLMDFAPAAGTEEPAPATGGVEAPTKGN